MDPRLFRGRGVVYAALLQPGSFFGFALLVLVGFGQFLMLCVLSVHVLTRNACWPGTISTLSLAGAFLPVGIVCRSVPTQQMSSSRSPEQRAHLSRESVLDRPQSIASTQSVTSRPPT